ACLVDDTVQYLLPARAPEIDAYAILLREGLDDRPHIVGLRPGVESHFAFLLRPADKHLLAVGAGIAREPRHLRSALDRERDRRQQQAAQTQASDIRCAQGFSSSHRIGRPLGAWKAISRTAAWGSPTGSCSPSPRRWRRLDAACAARAAPRPCRCGHNRCR